MGSDAEDVLGGSLEYIFCVSGRKGAAVGEDIDELGEFAFGCSRDHLVANFSYIVGSATLELAGNNMRAQKS